MRKLFVFILVGVFSFPGAVVYGLDLGDLLSKASKAALAPKSNTTNFCSKVQSLDIYKQYSSMTGDAVRGGYYSFGENPRIFDSNDRLLTEWMRKQFPKMFDSGSHSTDRISEQPIWLADRIFSRESQSMVDEYIVDANVVRAVEQCADQVLDTDFAYLFFRPLTVEKLRELNSSAKENDKVVREISASGDIVEKKIAGNSGNKLTYEKERTRFLFIETISVEDYSVREKKSMAPGFPHWLALVYGGEKILNVTGAEFIKSYESQLSTIKKGNEEARLAAEKKAAEEVALAATNAAAKAAAMASEEATIAAAKKVEEQRELMHMLNMERIKKRDYSQVKSCSEISEAMNATPTLFQTAVTPPNTLYAGAGLLKKHEDKADAIYETLKIYSEYLRVDRFGKLKLTKSTLVLDVGNRFFDSGVSFVGKYSANDTVRLTDGSSEQIPVFEAICVEY